MRRSLFYLTLFLGVFCWSMPQAGAKVNVRLINCEPMEKEAAIKLLKKIKCKLPMVMKDSELEVEELPGYSPGTAPAITIVDPTGKVRQSGGPELLDSWHSIVGAKAPARKAKETRTEEPEDEPEK